MPRAQLPDEERAHDVLAAEEFAVPAPDPGLHHSHLYLPDDPSGIFEPHDILAAEEFAMPAAQLHHASSPMFPRQPAWRRALPTAAAALVPLIVLRRLRRRG